MAFGFSRSFFPPGIPSFSPRRFHGLLLQFEFVFYHKLKKGNRKRPWPEDMGGSGISEKRRGDKADASRRFSHPARFSTAVPRVSNGEACKAREKYEIGTTGPLMGREADVGSYGA